MHIHTSLYADYTCSFLYNDIALRASVIHTVCWLSQTFDDQHGILQMGMGYWGHMCEGRSKPQE